MTVVSYVTKDGNETKSYAEALKAGIREVKYTKWKDPEDEKAVQEQIEFWRKYKRAQPSFYFSLACGGRATGFTEHAPQNYTTPAADLSRCNFAQRSPHIFS